MSAPEMSPAARLLRGLLIASSAVGVGALAHVLGGHHGPHPVVILLAVAVAAPISTALTAARLSRLRLALAVLASQAALHGLFVLLPAAEASSLQHGSAEGPHAHHAAFVTVSGGFESASHPSDVWMAASHAAAALVTYLLLRRGESVLAALSRMFGIAPIALDLWGAGPLPAQARLPQMPRSPRLPRPSSDVQGPCPTRGPPLSHQH
ncbi:hypothetical protein [Nesterenkonia sp. NBAIMH1]|uniref:hypothetical protein n=1 Tax=Nesterenkonia sp. NBAIMH1 TaxID=2600320 RepID=UPI0011B5B982|nr:hypothetical protein [Nesterenkonia sp. NBAIMH1]